MIFAIPLLNTGSKILLIISLTLWLASLPFTTWRKGIITAIIIALAAVGALSAKPPIEGLVLQTDTKYSTVSIVDKGNMRYMKINTAGESVKFLDSDELAAEYLKYYELAFHFNPKLKNTLCIGGAGYCYPQYYIARHEDCEMDVVEIDEGLTRLAREYFGLTDNPRLNVIHQDGRTFLNNNAKKYDAILGDAFATYVPPQELVTVEATRRVYDSLEDSGVYIINVISSIDGTRGKLSHAMISTLRAVFPQVYLFPVSTQDDSIPQNLILVALKSEAVPSFESELPDINAMLARRRELNPKLPAMTDDYAPVDFYVIGTY